MAWLFQAAVLSALLALGTSQFPFSGGSSGEAFEPFTNFDQYVQNGGRSLNGGFRQSPQSSVIVGENFSSPASSGNYDVTRSFNFDRQSVNGAPPTSTVRFSPQNAQPVGFDFDEGRQFAGGRNDFQFSQPISQPVTEAPRYYEPPTQRITYQQPRQIEAPRFQPPVYQPEPPRYRAVATPPPVSQQYQPQIVQPRQYSAAPTPPRFQPAPVPYQETGPSYRPVEAPVQPRYQATQAPYRPEPVEYRPTAAPYQPPPPRVEAPVEQRYQPPPTEAPYRPPRVSSRTTTEKPAVIHPAAPVHYVSIGQKLEGDYNFGYDTGKASNGDASFRRETRDPDGTVRGSYGYVDSNGKQIVVHYEAGKEGYKVLSEGEAKARSERARNLQIQATSAPREVQQYQPAPQPQPQEQPQEEQPVQRVRRVKKKRRLRRAVDDEDNEDEERNKESNEFGSRVASTGSLRPTGSPRVRPQRTRRPLNPDGRSLRPTESPVRERTVRRKVVVRTTTPVPAPPSPRPTVPRRQVIPRVNAVEQTPQYEEPTPPPQPKRRRKVKRKFRTTAAPELQQLQTPPQISPVTPSLNVVGPLPAHVLPPGFLQTPVSNPSPIVASNGSQFTVFNSLNNLQQQSPSPFIQHVNSPQSLYEQLTSSIYQEAGRVSPTRSFAAQPQPRYAPPTQQYSGYPFQQYNNPAPQYQTQQPRFSQFQSSPFQQYQQAAYQLPQNRFQTAPQQYQQPQQQQQPRDLYSYPSNIDYSRGLLSYDIGLAAQG